MPTSTPALNSFTTGADDIEKREWVESLAAVIEQEGPKRAAEIVKLLQDYAFKSGVRLAPSVGTPYVNTIPTEEQPPYPGDLAIERRIAHLVRWNALAMVVKGNREEAGIGGHIATFASCATLYEVAQNHFLRGREHTSGVITSIFRDMHRLETTRELTWKDALPRKAFTISEGRLHMGMVFLLSSSMAQT